jgi:8-oxo-dGTP pyrophosphatase MutT (NUDIX family)
MHRKALSAAVSLAATGAAASACFSQRKPTTVGPLPPCGRVLGRREVASTRWLRLETLTYEDTTGRRREWDVATRTTRQRAAGCDAVAILALLRRGGADVETLLVQQYRPPVDAVTVELPAGLIDEGETPEEAALRELKEETGYVGSVALSSGVVAMSPGLTDEAIKLCVVEVDLDDPANQAPVQSLDETEFIQVRRVPVKALLPTLNTMERDGLVPFAGLYTLAVGLSLGLQGGSSVSHL